MRGHHNGDLRVFYGENDPTDCNEHAIVAYVDSIEEASVILLALVAQKRDLKGEVENPIGQVEMLDAGEWITYSGKH